MHAPRLYLFLLTSILLSLVFFVGCNEDLLLRDDFPEPFTLYGVLTPDLDTQYVRIYPIDELPRLDQEVPEGIHFTSIDLNTGEEIVWRDTIDTASNGQQDLVFKALFKPEYGHTYRVQAMRVSDGASSYADVRIPPQVTIRTEEVILPAPNEAILRFIVEGESIRVLKPDITYTVFIYDERNRTAGPTRAYLLPHHREEVPIENGWEIPINVWVDRLFVQNFYNVEVGTAEGIKPFRWVLTEVRIDLIVGDAQWDPPFGLFNPNLLSHPEVLQNVENGLGFVGGGYRIAATFQPSCAFITDAEYLCLENIFDNEPGS